MYALSFREKVESTNDGVKSGTQKSSPPLAAILPLTGSQRPASAVNHIHRPSVRVAAKTHTIQLSGNFDGQLFYYGKYDSYFYINGKSGSLQKRIVKEPSTFKKGQSITSPLHFGNHRGLSIKVLYAVSELTVSLLSRVQAFTRVKRKSKMQAYCSYADR